jgi:ribosomal protein S18 acetylase RimI-like enzyme
MALAFQSVSALPAGISELASLASFEGFRMVRRLIDDYESGANTFSARGERLCAAIHKERVVAVGGLNVDPYFGSPSLGRIRHFYVHPDFRRSGVGSRLMRLIEADSEARFDCLQLFTTSAIAARFYEGMGYGSVSGRWKVSHAKWISV